jgi:hypothetical protein
MAEQPLNLVAARVSFRRRRRLLVVAALIGALGGAALVHYRPPEYSSTSLVLLGAAGPASSGGAGLDMDTQAQVARSDVVLRPARLASAPNLTRQEFSDAVDVKVATAGVLTIVARGPTAHQAQSRAQAVANSLVTYQTTATSSLSGAQRQALDHRRATLVTALNTVNSEIARTQARIANQGSTGPEGRADLSALAQLTAQASNLVLQIDSIDQQKSKIDIGNGASVIQPASLPRRPGVVRAFGLAVAAGIALALLLVGLLVLRATRRDRRLFLRDDIARALGRPVVASVRAEPRQDSASWQELFSSYRPDELDDLALRQTLLAVGLSGPPRGSKRSVRLTVVSLGHDPAGHAVGPQLAAHAANLGIPTRYTIVDACGAAPGLVSACAETEGLEVRPDLWLASKPPRTSGVALTLTHMIVDSAEPDSWVRPSPTSVLALSAGTATSHDVARAAVFVHSRGGIVQGCVVSNPDPADRTTGRLVTERPSGRRGAARPTAERDGDAA